jgi:hypothetical protein
MKIFSILVLVFVFILSGVEAAVAIGLLNMGAKRDLPVDITAALNESSKDEAYILDKVRKLLDAGAPVDGRNREVPLVAATCKGYDSVVQLLLDRGAAINAADKSQDWTALHCAAANGRMNIAKLLLARGAKCCELSATGTPAETAAQNQKIGLQHLLEEAGQGVRSAPIATVAAAPQAPAETLVPSFKSSERPDDLAVIIGIETYSEIQSKATYAERDADAFKAHVRALGVPERNIVLLKGSKAGKASFEKNIETWLARLAKPTSRVYFYFSGHGAPDVKTGQAYLVPWDGDPNFLDDTAYPVARLYRKLGALPAKQVLVAMDSCFSGAGGRSVLAPGARPLVAKIDVGAAPAKLTVLAASASNEISGSLEDKGHGAFTYFLLEGLNAGEKTPKALAAYLTPRVQDEAKRLNRDQTPQLQGDGAWSLR